MCVYLLLFKMFPLRPEAGFNPPALHPSGHMFYGVHPLGWIMTLYAGTQRFSSETKQQNRGTIPGSFCIHNLDCQSPSGYITRDESRPDEEDLWWRVGRRVDTLKWNPAAGVTAKSVTRHIPWQDRLLRRCYIFSRFVSSTQSVYRVGVNIQPPTLIPTNSVVWSQNLTGHRFCYNTFIFSLFFFF